MYKKAATIIINDVDLGGGAIYYPEKNEVLKGCAFSFIKDADLCLSLIINDSEVLIDSFNNSVVSNSLIYPDNRFMKVNLPLNAPLKFKATSKILVNFNIFIKTEIEPDVC